MTAATVWLISPKGRKEKGETTTMSNTNTKKARTPKQIAATKKLVALNKARKAGKTPAKPAAAKPKRSYAKQAAKPATRKTYKRNPLPPRVKEAGGILQQNIIPAAMGAGAALGFDLIWGKLPISDNLRAGKLKYPVKVIGALALGMLAERLLPAEHKHHAVTLARGPLTVILHDAGKDFMAKNYPSLTLAAYEAETMAEIMEEGYQVLPAPQEQAQPVGEALEFTMNSLEGLGNWYKQPQYAEAAY